MDDTSTSQQSQSTSQQDNRNVLGQGAIMAQTGGTVNVTTLDGAVAAGAFGVASDAVSASTKNLKYSLDFASSSQEKAMQLVTTTSDLVKDAYADAKGRGALTDKILIGAIAMAGIVAFAAVRK